MVPNGTGLKSADSTRGKANANPLTPGCGEGKYQYNIYYRVPGKENEQSVLKRPKLPVVFRQGYLKAVLWEKGHRMCRQLMDNFLIGWW